MITIDTDLLAQFLAAESDPASARKPTTLYSPRCQLCKLTFITADPGQTICGRCLRNLGTVVVEADPADAPPDCLVCGADAPCADCAEDRDWWEGVQLPELYESVHEMALRHSYSR